MRHARRPVPAIGRLLRLGAGLVVWASAFVFLYAGLSLGCAHLDPPAAAGLVNPVTALLAALALVHLFVLLALALAWWKRPVGAESGEGEDSRRFFHRVEGLVLAIAIAGLVWIAFPVFMVPPCPA